MRIPSGLTILRFLAVIGETSLYIFLAAYSFRADLDVAEISKGPMTGPEIWMLATLSLAAFGLSKLITWRFLRPIFAGALWIGVPVALLYGILLSILAAIALPLGIIFFLGGSIGWIFGLNEVDEFFFAPLVLAILFLSPALMGYRMLKQAKTCSIGWRENKALFFALASTGAACVIVPSYFERRDFYQWREARYSEIGQSDPERVVSSLRRIQRHPACVGQCRFHVCNTDVMARQEPEVVAALKDLFGGDPKSRCLSFKD